MTKLTPEIAIVILAAGQSRRMGSGNKLLMHRQGKAVLRHVAESAVASGAANIMIVTGYEAQSIRHELADLAVSFIHNPDYQKGMSSSVKAGIASFQPDMAGAIIMLGDMPAVPAEVLDALIERFVATGACKVCIPVAGGKRGNPVLLPRFLFESLQALEGDRGARDIIRANSDDIIEVEVESVGIHQDIDTPEDL